jgi:hypothetical protein
MSRETTGVRAGAGRLIEGGKGRSWGSSHEEEQWEEHSLAMGEAATRKLGAFTDHMTPLERRKAAMETSAPELW